MNPNHKRIVLISILVGLLIVLLLLVLLFRRDAEPTVQDVVPGINAPEEREFSNLSESEVIATQPVVDVPRTVDPGTADQGIVAKQAARIFVERFGTHSSQNGNAHIASVEALVTQSMWDWTRNQAQQQSLREYTGVTTEVIASTLTEFTPDTATVSLEARQIIESEGNSTMRARQGRVVLIRAANNWLVDAFYWDT
jgi:hypothetical protein